MLILNIVISEVLGGLQPSFCFARRSSACVSSIAANSNPSSYSSQGQYMLCPMNFVYLACGSNAGQEQPLLRAIEQSWNESSMVIIDAPSILRCCGRLMSLLYGPFDSIQTDVWCITGCTGDDQEDCQEGT